MSKLKPCPFCGGSAAKATFATCVSIQCLSDVCLPNVGVYYVDEAEAITAWNTRAAPPMKAWEWVESNAHGPAWKCDTFKALTYLAAGEWHVYIDLIFVGSVVASVQDAPELAKAIGVAYVERKLKEWLL